MQSDGSLKKNVIDNKLCVWYNIGLKVCRVKLYCTSILSCYFSVHCFNLLKDLYHDFATFPLIYSFQWFPQDPVKGGAYKWLEYLINKLNRGCFICHKLRILLYKYSRIYKYRSYSGNLIFDSSRLQEGIFVYTLVNCTIKLTNWYM